MTTTATVARDGRALTWDEVLTPAEVAALFRVDAKQVTRWARAGLLSSVRTPGGHRRYSRAEVLARLAASEQRRTP